MVLIQDRILKIDIYNFAMSQITPEKSLKSNQIYSVQSGEKFCSNHCTASPGTMLASSGHTASGVSVPPCQICRS